MREKKIISRETFFSSFISFFILFSFFIVLRWEFEHTELSPWLFLYEAFKKGKWINNNAIYSNEFRPNQFYPNGRKSTWICICQEWPDSFWTQNNTELHLRSTFDHAKLICLWIKAWRESVYSVEMCLQRIRSLGNNSHAPLFESLQYHKRNVFFFEFNQKKNHKLFCNCNGRRWAWNENERKYNNDIIMSMQGKKQRRTEEKY